jgi:hypothetical protein
MEKINYMDVQAILVQARNGNAPADWDVFEGKVHDVNVVEGTENDPLPLLVITSEYLIEYINSATPLTIIPFADFQEVRLEIVRKEFAFYLVYTRINLRLIDFNGKRHYWNAQPNFEDQQDVILQRLIEAHLKYRLQKHALS